MFKRLFWLPLALLLCAAVVAQEAACPDLVQQALDYIARQCSTIQRNQACYGNLQVNAVPLPDATDFKFDAPGDIADIAGIQSLSLSALTLPDRWGVMMMSVQADLPDSVPGQNVTMLLFGDVTLENKGGAVKPVLLDVTASRNVRVRSGPGTQNGQIGSLSAGDAVQADGRNEDSSWLRVIVSEGTAGWVSADLVQVTGDISTLAVVEGTEIAGTTYGPMQAFYFTSGIGSADCIGAPQDGLLIQTPEGAGKVDLLINEVQVSVGSTLYMTAQTSGDMDIAVLEGESIITAGGTTVTVPAGAQAGIPLDANGLPAGAPKLESYDDETIGRLADLFPALPDAITPAPAVNPEDLVIVPLSGQWSSTTAASSMTCTVEGFTTTVPLPGASTTLTLNFADGAIVVTGGEGEMPPPLQPTGPDTYSVSYSVEGSADITITLRAISPEELSGSMVMSGTCNGTIALTMSYRDG